MNEIKKKSITDKINKRFKKEITIEIVQLLTYFILGLVSLSMFIVSIVYYNIMNLISILIIINIVLSVVVLVMIIILTK